MMRRRPATPSPIGLREDQLDITCRHFGPVMWLEDAAAWARRLELDRPQQVFVLAEEAGAWRVVEVRDAHAPLPTADGRDLRLRYHHRHHGLSVAVCLPIERHQWQAAD